MPSIKQVLRDVVARNTKDKGVCVANKVNAKPMIGGVRNENFDDLMWVAALGARLNLRSDNKLVITHINTSEIDFAILKRMSNAGFEFANFQYWIELTDAELLTDVPAFLPRPNRTVDGVERPRMWGEWKDANHEHKVIAGKNYVPTDAYNQEHLFASDLVLLFQAGYTLLSLSDMHELIAAQPGP